MADGAPSSGPPITVITTDEQDFMEVDSQRWAELAVSVAEAEAIEGPVEIGLGFVEEDAIAALHAEHLGGEGPTDVLSFPLDDDGSEVPDGQPRLLGDVVLCPEVAASQAEQASRTVDEEIAVLVVHGILHLLGFDHRDSAEEAVMFARQAELVTEHHRP